MLKKQASPENSTTTRSGGRLPEVIHSVRLPAGRFCSASAIHKRFLEWDKAGFFEAGWKAGLTEYDDMQGIAWRWQSVDGAMIKAPMAQEAVGPNPTDRGKKWKQTSSAGGRSWRPVVAHRERGQRPRLQEA
jgi:hypothetical protein